MDLQREYVADSYRATESKVRLKSKNPDAKLVFDNQKEAAMEIQRLFELGISAVTLLALPQVGKTGVMVQLAFLMATHADEKLIIGHKNIFIITGMSDKDWLTQTKDNFPDAFEHIYTRSGFNKLNNLEHVRDALFIIDECHIAVEEKNQSSTCCVYPFSPNYNYFVFDINVSARLKERLHHGEMTFFSSNDKCDVPFLLRNTNDRLGTFDREAA
jgi:hypothetical protein